MLEPCVVLLNQKDVEGWTPAHCAAAEGHLDILRLLGKYGPLVGIKLWELYAEYPVDLEAKTCDGESIEDVSLPETKNEIIRILKDLRSMQNLVNNKDQGYCNFNPPNNLQADTEKELYKTRGILSKTDIGSLSSITLFPSNECIFSSQQPLNTHLNIKESRHDYSSNSDKENDPNMKLPITIADATLEGGSEQSSDESLTFSDVAKHYCKV